MIVLSTFTFGIELVFSLSRASGLAPAGSDNWVNTSLNYLSYETESKSQRVSKKIQDLTPHYPYRTYLRTMRILYRLLPLLL